MRTRDRKWSNRVLGAGLVMVTFAYPHLIDDFLYNVPQEFGLTNQVAQGLAGLFSLLLLAVFCAAARGNRWGYAGTGFLGGFLALAVLLKHVPKMMLPEPYWSGVFSETLNWGLLVSGGALMLISFLSFQRVTGQGS
jgi:hypothetical protein